MCHTESGLAAATFDEKRSNPGSIRALYNTETVPETTRVLASRSEPRMEAVILQSVSKVFHHRPALFNLLGRERTGETRALNSVSLQVRSGSVLVLLGPNGSGKTTTLKLISTMLLPDSGEVIVQGADSRRDPFAVRRAVGFAVATERSFFPRLSARENLDFFAALDDIPRSKRSERIEQILRQTQLQAAADTLVMKFSSGMYQRLGIARALIKKPSVVLLDEPTRSLDPGSAAQFWNLVRSLPAQGATVILATHNFNEAVAVGNDVAILFHGSLAAERHLTSTMSMDELRSFYFQTTGELEDVEPAASGAFR